MHAHRLASERTIRGVCRGSKLCHHKIHRQLKTRTPYELAEAMQASIPTIDAQIQTNRSDKKGNVFESKTLVDNRNTYGTTSTWKQTNSIVGRHHQHKLSIEHDRLCKHDMLLSYVLLSALTALRAWSSLPSPGTWQVHKHVGNGFVLRICLHEYMRIA